VFSCINVVSSVDSFTIKSLNITLDKKEDWNKNENIDQSKVAMTEVFSQLSESDNHI
jgi:hypothetical protein